MYNAMTLAENVAPLAGAWIEIEILVILGNRYHVAPLAGAWIEIRLKGLEEIKRVCRSPRGSVD